MAIVTVRAVPYTVMADYLSGARELVERNLDDMIVERVVIDYLGKARYWLADVERGASRNAEAQKVVKRPKPLICCSVIEPKMAMAVVGRTRRA